MHVHTIEKLTLSAPEGKRLVVLGDPIAHSLSPDMHNAALREMSTEHPDLRDWRYEAVHVSADDLKEALLVLHRAGVMGINLTIPHKVRALDLVEAIEEEARLMGAVNTLIRTDTGYRGTNTDGYGLRRALEEAFHLQLGGRDVWLFGAGGAARGIVVACLQAGCARLTILNRSEPRLRELEQQVRGSGLETADKVRFYGLSDSPKDAQPSAVLINATALGLKPTDPSPMGTDYLTGDVHVYDTTYGVRNALAAECANRGIVYADGLSMLVWQGVRSLEIWTGLKVPVDTMRKAAETRLKERTKHV